MRTENNPSGLIYAVLFANATDLPSDVKTIQYKDLSEWAISSPAFKETKLYVDFELEMKNLCKELANMILAAPPWQENWPVVTPQPALTITAELPRLQ